MKILVAEDDLHTREGIAEVLNGEGYAVVRAENGKEALAQFVEEKPDLVLLDIMMPEVDGYATCREIRRGDPTVPIIFLSAKSEEIDKVLGLELGADDYIIKPFGTREVIARIRAVMRRREPGVSVPDPESFTMRDLKVVPAELRAYRGKTVLELAPREAQILALLYRNRGKVLDRNQIFDACWGEDYMPNSRCLDQYIAQLRKKVEKDPRHPRIIETVHGAGYRFDG